MSSFKHILLTSLFAAIVANSFAQYINSGVSAGFFDSSEGSAINFSTFHLPPLGVLYENAKQNPQILSLAKAQEIAQAEVAKQRRHIFSYVYGHASYSYGKTDMWGQGSTSHNLILQQYQGSTQSYWNVGVNLNIPLEDILDLRAAVKRKKLEVDQARIKKDEAFDKLKLEIATLYIKITNNLVALKTSSEAAAIYQGAGALNQEDFHQGNLSIEGYQGLQTQITTDIITLELLTHTPILTNTTTDITLEEEQLSEKQIRKENKAIEKKIRKNAAAEEKRFRQMEEAELKAQKKAAKALKNDK